jgi:branched-chain amino acid transport system permease protein
MLMVGGSGSNRGAILGAYVVWGFWTLTGLVQPHLPEALEARTSYIRDLLIGLLIVVMLLLRPHGLMGEEKRVSLFAAQETKGEASQVDAPAIGPTEG